MNRGGRGGRGGSNNPQQRMMSLDTFEPPKAMSLDDSGGRPNPFLSVVNAAIRANNVNAQNNGAGGYSGGSRGGSRFRGRGAGGAGAGPGRGGGPSIFARVGNTGDAGDVNMAGIGQQPRGGGARRHNPYAGGRAPHRPNAAAGSTAEVTIKGWNVINHEVMSLLKFLGTKLEAPVQFLGHEVKGDLAVIKVKNMHDAEIVVKLNGIRYAGGKLSIMINRGAPLIKSDMEPEETFQTDAIPTLTAFIQSRYHPETKALYLGQILMEPIIAANPSLNGFGKDSVETGKIAPVICKLIGQLHSDILTISFESNQIMNLAPFESLSRFCPLLQNLSFRDNSIQGYREVAGIKGVNFKNLRELLLVSNPVRDRNVKNGDVEYRNKIKEMFPTLQVLDMQDFEEEISIPEVTSADVAAALPQTEKDSFMDSEVTANTVQEFVPKFFELFDKNRSALSDLYADQARFSVSLNMELRRKGNQPRGRNYNQEFQRWIPFDRNHLKVSDAGKRSQLIANGPQAIINCFGRLPTTSHPYQSLAEKKMFVSDAFQLQIDSGVCLMVNVHGELADSETRRHLSFSRSFVIIPAPPNSRAQMAGWPYAILNDALVLRSFAQDRVWLDKPPATESAKPTAGPLFGVDRLGRTGAAAVSLGGGGGMSLNAALNGGALPPDPQILLAMKAHFGLDDAQHSIVCQFAVETGLNYQFSLDCLIQTQWQPLAAMEAFNHVRANIPPEAFTFQPPQ